MGFPSNRNTKRPKSFDFSLQIQQTRIECPHRTGLMRIRRCLSLTVFTFLVFAAVGVASAQNSLLRTLAQEDQDSRTGKTVQRTDDERLWLVLEQLAKGAVQTPEDRCNAARVLQNSALGFRDDVVVAKSPNDYLLAHFLAKASFETGYKPARWLVAATLDRYLSFTEGYQKYGTQRLFNQKLQREELVPIDRSTTDEERARFGVAPLDKLLKQYPEQPRKTPQHP